MCGIGNQNLKVMWTNNRRRGQQEINHDTNKVKFHFLSTATNSVELVERIYNTKCFVKVVVIKNEMMLTIVFARVLH